MQPVTIFIVGVAVIYAVFVLKTVIAPVVWTYRHVDRRTATT